MTAKARSEREIGKRLAEFRSGLGLLQVQLAEKLGIGEQSYGRSERGQRPLDAKELLKLAELGAPLNWLLTGDESPGQMSQSQSQTVTYSDFPNDFIVIPRYDVRASAGPGSAIISEEVLGFIAFRRSWFRRHVDGLVMIEVNGDSMMPTLSNGDLVMIDRSEQSLRHGRIYVLNVDGDLIVKRVERQATGGIVLRSDNRSLSPQRLTSDQASRLSVIGEVVWHGHAL